MQMSTTQRLNAFKKIFRDRLIDFLEKCMSIMSENTLKHILGLMDNGTDFARLIQLLAGEQLAKYAQTCSTEFRNYMVEFLVKNFQALYL